MTGTFSSRGLGLAIVIATTLFAAPLFAQRSDKASVITFNSPVEIPGSNPQVLPAGTYMFKIVDSKSSPHIVQVSNREGSKVYSTIMAIPAHRDATTRDTVITFEERGGGQPQAVQTWFYPNDTSGEEFVYSGKPLTQVAATTSSAPAAVVEAPKPDVPVTNAEPAAPPVVAQAPPAPEPAPQQQAAAPPPPAPAPEPQVASPAPSSNVQEPQNPEPATLPHTASNLPMLLLAGMLALGAGLSIRVLSRE